ncbi:hypothetical protein LTR37_007294 [Vermiconidia calcicola]|uniref:Uncharacterized protein n=1 Tax=Vermiconidia calcicola TaxID=1690605 RepID=A0ACC3NF61_9PEZI|nr:hypothetical protein LTR37_007294 [Vermiconidia calcicola]
MAATTPLPTAATVSTTGQTSPFLRLLPELRNKLYLELLPVPKDWKTFGEDFDEKRRDPQRGCHTSIIAVCKQIHSETASILYGNHSFKISVHTSGDVSFLGREIQFARVRYTNFFAINQFRKLTVSVRVDKGEHVCDVQDTLFTLFRHLCAKNKLRILDIRINLAFEIWRPRFRSLEQRIPDLHVVHFLTDPLLLIRNLDQKCFLVVHFNNCAGAPWKKMREDVRSVAFSNKPVPNYTVFSEYFEILKRWKAALVFDHQHEIGSITRAEEDLIYARIKGDVGGFRDAHHALTAAVRGLNWALSVDCAGDVSKIRMELAAAIPDDSTDTSFFEYSRTYDIIREWQKRERKGTMRLGPYKITR